MNVNMRRRILPGTFLTHDRGSGAWRLSRGEPASVEIYIAGVDPSAAEVLATPGVGDVDIEWHSETVVLTMTLAERKRSIKARSALVHEPLAHLYDALPLAVLDAKGRRFWRRVFRLVRIPGGRYLLEVLARRARVRNGH